PGPARAAGGGSTAPPPPEPPPPASSPPWGPTSSGSTGTVCSAGSPAEVSSSASPVATAPCGPCGGCGARQATTGDSNPTTSSRHRTSTQKQSVRSYRSPIVSTSRQRRAEDGARTRQTPGHYLPGVFLVWSLVVARSPDRATGLDRRSPLRNLSRGKEETFGRRQWHGQETVPQQGWSPAFRRQAQTA